MLPDGAFKGAVWVAGDVDMIPRLDESIGWILLAYSGAAQASSVANGSAYKHYFPGVPDTFVPNKWLTARRLTPASAAADEFGETFIDLKPTQIVFNVTPGNVLGMRTTFGGLFLAERVTDPRHATPAWAPSYEDFTGVPIATRGAFNMYNNTPFRRVTNLTLTLGIGAPDARQELVVGQYYPHDITPLSRQIQVAFTAFYTDADLYKKLSYADGASWSPVVWEAGAFNCYFQTPSDTVFGAGTKPGELGFQAARMFWRADPITLRGGDTVVMRVTGTVLKAASEATTDWSVWLQNSKSSYIWPT